MSTNSATQNSSPGFFNSITSAVSGAVNSAKKAVAGNNTKKNNSTKNNSTKNNSTKNNSSIAENATALPVTANVNVPVMKGGVAPVNFRYPPNMQQPSEAVMEWATTADTPMPPASEMRNVAHGGKRKTHKRSTRKHRSHRRKSTHKRHSSKHSRRHRSKTHRRRHHRRR
jgi:hypothetical protein